MRVSQALKQSIILLMLLAFASSLTGCQLLKGSKPGAGKAGSASTAAGGGARRSAAPGSSLIMGDWQVSYAVNGETQSAHMTFKAVGDGFEGTGTDDANGQNFVIDTGFISGNSVGFHKRYHVDENPNLPPIVYDGTFEMVSNDAYKGPYMHGSYKLSKGDGPAIAGDWDAQKVENQQGGRDAQTAATQAAPPQQPQTIVDPSKPPDLSGKWTGGYEYEFKTFHTKMFIEQDGAKLAGHGVDTNTNEAFTITGTFNFPTIKLIHKYPELKLGKGKTKAPRSLEFRGKVEVVSEPEYQGPRMIGKNIGGGDWMAEEVR